MKNLTTDETFALAVQNHQKNNLQVAEKLYKKVLNIDPDHFKSIHLLGTLSAQIKNLDQAKQLLNKAITINPNFSDAHYNLGIVLKELKEYKKEMACYEKAIQINPNFASAHNNLGNVLKELKEYKKAINSYQKAIQINPNYVHAHNNLGLVFHGLGDYQKAKSCYEKAIQINPNFASAHNNLGIVFRELVEFQKAINFYQKAIQINPNFASAHNNLGLAFYELGGENQKARSCYEKAIQIDPNYSDVYWNSHLLASDVDEALTILKKLYEIDKKYIKAKIMISVLESFKGNFSDFDALNTPPESDHPLMRSARWISTLPKLPKIFFNRWDFFDAVVALTDKSRPFYEFGVWTGTSFQYLINTFKKGFGFDTFTGLPEDWHHERAGTYSSFGSVPKIEGGKFIVGKFEDTLPKFFSKKRPLASLINFDADLYSSTLCALNYSNKVIDEKTILIFDEFLTNKDWEKDEYKALQEFCHNFSISYDVLAVSFSTKQVAVKLKKN